MKAADVIRQLEKDGWYHDRTNGSHHMFKHPLKVGTISVPFHGKSDIKTGTLNSILKQAGLK